MTTRHLILELTGPDALASNHARWRLGDEAYVRHLLKTHPVAEKGSEVSPYGGYGTFLDVRFDDRHFVISLDLEARLFSVEEIKAFDPANVIADPDGEPFDHSEG